MKKRVIILLAVIFFTGAFLMGCSEKETYNEAEDPWATFRVSKSEVNENKWMGYYYFVKQDKQIYKFMCYPDITALQTKGGFLVYNDIPAFVYEEGDSLRYYYYDIFHKKFSGDRKADKINLIKVNPPKGALNFQFEYLYDNSKDTLLKEFENYSVLEENSVIIDKDGNEIGDVWNNMYNLNIDETYKISVTEEAGVYENELTADWLFYSCDDFDDVIKIHPDLSNKEYATYDLSSLEPGYYCVINYAYNIIEIR